MEKIYLDIDGVLADWEWGVQNLLGLKHITVANYHVDKNIYSNEYYQAILRYQKNGGLFWYDLPLMPDAKELWEYVSSVNLRIGVITAVGHSINNAASQKVGWLHKHFSKELEVITVERTRQKYTYCKPYDILVDDQERALEAWIENGGIGIHHKNASSTITELATLLGDTIENRYSIRPSHTHPKRHPSYIFQ